MTRSTFPIPSRVAAESSVGSGSSEMARMRIEPAARGSVKASGSGHWTRKPIGHRVRVRRRADMSRRGTSSVALRCSTSARLAARGPPGGPRRVPISDPASSMARPGCDAGQQELGHIGVDLDAAAWRAQRRPGCGRRRRSSPRPTWMSSIGGSTSRRSVALMIRCHRPRQFAPRSRGSGRKSRVFCDGWRTVPTIRSSGTIWRPMRAAGRAASRRMHVVRATAECRSAWRHGAGGTNSAHDRRPLPPLRGRSGD